MQAESYSVNSNELSRVLLVEDHEGSAKIETALLKELGYECDHAWNGMEALGKFTERRYFLIVMDLELPDIDGLEIAKRVRRLEQKKNLPPTPIIGITGRATIDDKILCKKAGMNSYLPKPFRLKDLEEKIQNCR